MYGYFEFKVSLQEVNPQIWRKFLIRKEATFQDLHQAIQDAADWWNCHLFAFRTIDHVTTIAIHPNAADQIGLDPKKIRLTSYFGRSKAKQKDCAYEYDFGDGWIHDVKLLQEVELPYKFKRCLLDGARAFPHEDSGGIGGYERFVEFLKTGEDPWEEDPDDLMRWLGGWSPESFDLKISKKRFDK